MSAASRILLSIVAIVIAAAAIAAWVIRGPGPLAFAGGETVALADYHGQSHRTRRLSGPRRRLHGLPQQAGG